MNKVTILLLMITQLNACSFHSIQYDSLKRLVIQEDSSLKPEKNWIAYWVNQQIALYAINLEDQIIFADDDINIFYKDKQIYKITGLLPKSSVLEIDSNDGALVYILNGKKIGVDPCEAGESAAMVNLSERYSRFCSESKSEKRYENQIIVNSEGMITSMQFKVHPDYPLLQLSMK